jgi:hypothetical protein
LCLGKSQVSLNVSEFSEASEFLQLEKNSEDSFDENDSILTFFIISLFSGNVFVPSALFKQNHHKFSNFLKIKNLRGPPVIT